MILENIEEICDSIPNKNIKAVLGEIALSISRLASVVELNDQLVNKLLKGSGVDKDTLFELKNKMILEVESEMKDLAKMLWELPKE